MVLRRSATRVLLDALQVSVFVGPNRTLARNTSNRLLLAQSSHCILFGSELLTFPAFAMNAFNG